LLSNLLDVRYIITPEPIMQKITIAKNVLLSILTLTHGVFNYKMEYDSVILNVISAFKRRAEIGQIKYGKTLDRNDLTFLQWIQHAQEELMDGILYLEKIKQISGVTEDKLFSLNMQDRPSPT